MAQDIDDALTDLSYEEVIESSERTLDDFGSASVVMSDSEETQVRPGVRTIPKEAFENLKKDETFFFSLVTFRIGDRLFRVPRDAFENQSQYFRDLFAEQITAAPDGSLVNDIMAPIFLPDVDVDAFRDLLRLLFPPSRISIFSGRVVLSNAQWIKVLELAHAWQFTGIYTLAIQELESQSRPPTGCSLGEVNKLELALKYDIKQWYLDAYLALVKRQEPLTAEEGERLGLDRSLKISAVRERRLARMLQQTQQTSKVNAGSANVTNTESAARPPAGGGSIFPGIDYAAPSHSNENIPAFGLPYLKLRPAGPVSQDNRNYNNSSVPDAVPSRTTGEQHPRTTLTSAQFGNMLQTMCGTPRSPPMSATSMATAPTNASSSSTNGVGTASSAGTTTHAEPTRYQANQASTPAKPNADCEDVLLKKDINETFGL